ncbi:SDR family oxidoreductase [Paenibacillus terreus]|uniref:SDR family oxidoreductase n=1 Tax=Paenibacillus terreus TaxID=1387834 RepID=A0ABV5B8M8_9BACL
MHFKGVFFLIQKLFPYITDKGCIVNPSSGLTRVSFEGGHGTYTAMKCAIEVLTRYMTKEWGCRGIRVNTAAPGTIETDFAGGASRSAGVNASVSSQTVVAESAYPTISGALSPH